MIFRIPKALFSHPPLAPWYILYLQSPHWLKLRRKIIRFRGKRCSNCGITRKPLTLHHLTYERVFREEIYDVELLCSICHKEQHTRRIIPFMERIYDPNWRPNG
jgi:5-methylcytosine-specific restriction endonuclease McrA